MPHIMKVLGVRSADEWAALAWSRPEDADTEACEARRTASNQMLAIMAAGGFTPNDEFFGDAELLITGRMSHEEYQAYVSEKYKEAA